VRLGHGITLRELHRNTGDAGGGTADGRGSKATSMASEETRTLMENGTVCPIGEREMEIGTWIRRVHDGLKYLLRGRMSAQEFQERVGGLRKAMEGMTRQTVMGGGRIGEMAYELLRLAGAALEKRVTV
jgi:hypothetical protein